MKDVRMLNRLFGLIFFNFFNILQVIFVDLIQFFVVAHVIPHDCFSNGFIGFALLLFFRFPFHLTQHFLLLLEFSVFI